MLKRPSWLVLAILSAGCGRPAASPPGEDLATFDLPAGLSDSAMPPEEADQGSSPSDLGVITSDFAWPAADAAEGPVITPRSNINASLATGAQSEADIAIDPTNTPYFNHLLAASNDAATGQVSVYETNNGATTWITHKLPPPLGSFTGPTRHATVAYDAQGNGLVSVLVSDPMSTSSAIAVSSRPAGSGGFSRLVVVPNSTADRQRIAVDRSLISPRLNTVYLAWTDEHDVWVAASTDGGATFGAPVQVNDDGDGATSPYPSLATDGTLYVAWLDSGRGQLRIDRSVDGGATFGVDHVMHVLSATGITASTLAAPSSGARLAPFCDVDRSHAQSKGSIYCAYTDAAGADGLDVFLRRSTDGGATWSPPRRMNDDAPGTSADQFLPRVQVDDGNGKVSVAWYDTRDDPAHLKTHIYFTRANDGAAFVPSVRVTNTPSDMSNGAEVDGYGESIGMEAWDGRVRVLWTDTRTGDPDLFSCIIDFARFAFFFSGSGTLTMPGLGSASMNVTIQPVGPFVTPVHLSVLGLPAGASASFSVDPVPPGASSTVTVSAGTAAPGSYPVALKGNGGGEQDSRPMVVVIQ